MVSGTHAILQETFTECLMCCTSSQHRAHNAANEPGKALGLKKFALEWRRQITSKEANKSLSHADRSYRENRDRVETDHHIHGRPFQGDTWKTRGKNILDRGQSRCQGLQVGRSLQDLRNNDAAGVATAGDYRRGDKAREAGARTRRSLPVITRGGLLARVVGAPGLF